jgi:hypothetical protein
MRIALFLVLFLITIAGALAALEDEQYIVVVGASAPASDVVIAANFVASMKATLGVTFVSALDTDVARIENYNGKTIVVIDGKNREAKIFGTSNAAAVANTYFSRQGFDVESESTAREENVGVETEEIPPPSKPIVPPALDEEIGIDIPAIVNTSLNVTVPVNPVVEGVPEALPPARERTPGVFKRVWTWFSGWFS